MLDSSLAVFESSHARLIKKRQEEYPVSFYVIGSLAYDIKALCANDAQLRARNTTKCPVEKLCFQNFWGARVCIAHRSCFTKK